MLANLAAWVAELKAQGKQRPLDRTDGRVVALRKSKRRSFREIIEDIFDRLQPVPTGCWEWQAGCTNGGYGEVAFHMCEVRVNIAMWRIFHGGYDTKLKVCHSCNNPPCANPQHLYLATHMQNVRDAVRDGLVWWPRGEAHGKTKLNEQQVVEIRKRYAAGAPLSLLDKTYGQSTWNIIRGATWRHVPMPPELITRFGNPKPLK